MNRLRPCAGLLFLFTVGVADRSPAIGVITIALTVLPGLSAKPAVWERTAPASRPSGRPCPMSAVVPPAELLFRPSAPRPHPRPHCREQRSRAAYQRQHHRRVLRRIQAPSLRAQRRRNQQHECNSKHYQRRVLHRYPLSKAESESKSSDPCIHIPRDCPARLRGQRLKALPRCSPNIVAQVDGTCQQ
jgi:hypothetical protein